MKILFLHGWHSVPGEPFADSEELVSNCGLLASALIEVGNDHMFAEAEPLELMQRACDRLAMGNNK